MSEPHATGRSADRVGQLFTDLESWAERLGDPGSHFSVNRRPNGGWLVTVFVRPIEDPEVRVRTTLDGPYGFIEARSTDLADALAGAIAICRSVARDEAVPA